MKKALLIVLSVSLFLTASANTYKLLRNSATWATTSNWSPAGIPGNGDTAIISDGTILTLSNDLTLNNAYLNVYGSLVLSGLNMKMALTGNSTINLHTGATLFGSKASQQVILGSIIYQGNSPVLAGPTKATATSNGFVKYTEFVILPVTFTSFEVARSSAGYTLRWGTADERNAARFEVQRSTDGATWKTIVTMAATGERKNNYAYIDRTAPAGAVSYRIREVDADGAFTLSPVRRLADGDAATTISTLGNTVIVRFAQVATSQVKIEIVGLDGHIAAQQTVRTPGETVQVATAGLRGIYIVHISNGQGLNKAKQVLL